MRTLRSRGANSQEIELGSCRSESQLRFSELFPCRYRIPQQCWKKVKYRISASLFHLETSHLVNFPTLEIPKDPKGDRSLRILISLQHLWWFSWTRFSLSQVANKCMHKIIFQGVCMSLCIHALRYLITSLRSWTWNLSTYLFQEGTGTGGVLSAATHLLLFHQYNLDFRRGTPRA